MDEEFLHVPARHFDEIAAHAVPDSARAAVQHEPNIFRFIQANFDEVIAGAEGAEMIRVIAAIELWMLFENGVVARFERLPDFIVAYRNLPPSAHVAAAPVIGAAMRNCLFDRAADALQMVRQITRIQIRLYGHHAATNVHANGGRDDRAFRGNDAADSCSDAPVHVRHGRNPLEDEGKLRNVQKLLARLFFQWDALGPGFDWYTGCRREDVIVFFIRHGGSS